MAESKIFALEITELLCLISDLWKVITDVADIYIIYSYFLLVCFSIYLLILLPARVIKCWVRSVRTSRKEW
jgi:hypothetical protein